MSDTILTDRHLSKLQSSSVRDFIIRQLNNFYGITNADVLYIDKYITEAITRTLNCFSHIKNKYYSADNINVLHSGQYFIFLYYLANTIYNYEINNKPNYADYTTNARRICDKIYCLNKAVCLCEVYYEVELPEYFLVEHPLASVIGRAKIGNGFMFIQGCTVGGNGGKYPIIGENVFMYSNSKILGDSQIGNNVLIGANCYIKDMVIPDDTMVFGQYPKIIMKKNYGDKIKKIIEQQFVL